MKHWTTDEERALLLIIKERNLHPERNLLSAIDGRRTRNSQVYPFLAEAMSAKGYGRPADVCRNKLKSLRQKYNNHRQTMNRSGAGNLEDLPNQDLLQDLLGGRPAVPAAISVMDLTFPEPVAEADVGEQRSNEPDTNDVSTEGGRTSGDGKTFNLKWNDFGNTVTAVFADLRQDEELVDITLCCEGKKVKAHRMMLSACSPYFRDLLKENPCQHPVFFLKDTTYNDLQAVIEFVYNGEVNVPQAQLSSFIKTANMLQVKGLTGLEDTEKDSSASAPPSSRTQQRPAPPRPVPSTPSLVSRPPAPPIKRPMVAAAPPHPLPPRPSPPPPHTPIRLPMVLHLPPLHTPTNYSVATAGRTPRLATPLVKSLPGPPSNKRRRLHSGSDKSDGPETAATSEESPTTTSPSAAVGAPSPPPPPIPVSVTMIPIAPAGSGSVHSVTVKVEAVASPAATLPSVTVGAAPPPPSPPPPPPQPPKAMRAPTVLPPTDTAGSDSVHSSTVKVDAMASLASTLPSTTIRTLPLPPPLPMPGSVVLVSIKSAGSVFEHNDTVKVENMVLDIAGAEDLDALEHLDSGRN